MSDASGSFEQRLQRLSPRLRPRAAEAPGSGHQWRIETIVLALVFVLLAVASVNDVVLGTHTNHRLVADLRTWRSYTGHNYKNISTEEDVHGFTTTDVVCGNTTPGPPKERTQLCLQLTGPVDRRAPRGARRLVPAAEGRRPAPLPLRLLRLGQGPRDLPAMSAVASVPRAAARTHGHRLPPWWPLAALVLLAAVLRLSTLDVQSFWYDEAFTPVHVLHSSLSATLHAVVHTENTPPLWYLIAWLDARVLGDGEIALRLPSALAGIATVPVVWAIAAELAGRRAALLAAALVAVNPLFVWYSQEARAYGLFVLTAALAMLCFVRALREPTRGRLALFALAGALALLSHYFAVFLLAPMVLWLLADPRARRAAVPVAAALALVGLALLPLISAQGGHGTQWIGRWALSSRLQAIPQYYLTGYSGAPLGHGVELLVALPLLALLALGAWRLLEREPAAPGGPATIPGGAERGVRGGAATTLGDGETARGGADTAPGGATAAMPTAASARSGAEGAAAGSLPSLRRAAWIVLSIAACGVLAPIVLVGFGADYLAPRNLVAAMVAVTVLLAILASAIDCDGAARGSALPAALRLGTWLAAALAVIFLVISIDVELSPRLQRGNWRGLARALARDGGAGGRAITTVELGAAPLEYYLPGLANLARHASVTVAEIDETGYAPLRASAGRAPAPGFHLSGRVNVDGLIAYRFVSSVPRLVSEAELRRHVITLAHPEVLVPTATRLTATAR